MNEILSSLQINGKTYNTRELHELISRETGANAADWKRIFYECVAAVINEDEFIPVQTSGSTGTPKIIRLKKEHCIASARKTTEYFAITENSNMLLCMPCDHIAGIMMVFRAFVSKANLRLQKPSAHINFDKGVFDFCAVTPHQLRSSIDSINADDCKKILVGGAAVPTDLEHAALQKDCLFFHSYGMTETCSHIAVRKFGEKVFTPFPGVRLSLDAGQCLVIHAPDISDSDIITNDIVLFHGNAFEWTGRADNIINSGGIKLSPELIEAKLASVFDFNFIISSVPHEDLGEALVFITEEGVKTKDEEISAVCRECLEKYEIPKSVYRLPALFYTKNGKINRDTCRKAII